MKYKDLREFITMLESRGLLKRLQLPISPVLEMTEISDRVLRQQGPALLFENVAGFSTPVLTNLFGTPERVALAMGLEEISGLREIGEILAFLRQPEPPKNLKEAFDSLPIFKKILDMAPKVIGNPACREVLLEGAAVDLAQWPIQTCWPEDAAPLLTWGLVITKGPSQKRQNLGIYRQQVLGKNKVIMRWLKHRGGALDYFHWQQQFPKEPFPLAVALGADPATTLAAVTPIPDSVSEYAFAGLLRGGRSEVAKASVGDLLLPANAEMILEGHIYPGETALEGPFGDHTGYYNEVDTFPVFTIEKISHRKNPIYHSTYTGKPPDEPAILGVALNEVFVPILQRQFPEIIDFYLPPEGCSYRLAVVRMKKSYPGHAKRIMLGIWSFLRQFMYTKFIIVVDEDVDIRRWSEVIWAITTRVDPSRDTVLIDHTPIDYLDFASPVSGLGSKMGLDATNKWSGESQREWGKPIAMTQAVREKIDTLWQKLGIG